MAHSPLPPHHVHHVGLWALIFAAMAILGTIAQTGITGAGSSDWLNWYIPIALIVVGMKFNEWYPARVRESVAGHQ